ncbi:MAG TPA: hypothetical protein PKH15_07730 [Bacteroidales bacterium]|nr:hypothetical protein [Bacteroidales bacterium]
MERIYFDKQIFSYLFKGEDPIYRKLLSDLYSQKNNFLFCYSHGHLLDLKNDKTDIKYRELEFIESLVGDNYLSYHAIDKRTSCYLAKPLEAFKDVEEEEPISFCNLFDGIDLSIATEEQKVQIEKAKDLFTNQKIDFGFSQIQDIPDDISAPLKKVLPIGISSMTLMEWIEHFMGMVNTMEEDKTIYKVLRNVVDKYLNNGKFTVDYNSIDFNDDLKNSVLQKSFIEYVNGNLNPNGNKEISDYDFFVNAYFTLDLLGISKEPSKTVKFRNVMNDGYHSYYGAFCDYVVSDDQGFLKKTKAMYKLLNIKTEVMHIEEFIGFFSLLSNNTESTSTNFFHLLINDLKNGIVISSKPSLRFNRYTTSIKPYHKYLGYFNIIESIKEDNHDYIFLYRTSHNYSYFSFYREYEGVINKAVRLFGTDINFKGDYDWEKENAEINEGKWKGRFWEFDNFTILIEINKGNGKLSLLISMKETKK